MKPLLISTFCGFLIGGLWAWADRKPGVQGDTLPSTAKAGVAVSSPQALAPGPAAPKPGDEVLHWLERIASASREELLELSLEMFAGKSDYYLVSLLWDRWVELDPEGGYRALLDGEIVRENRMHQVWAYLGKWAAKDPDTAISKTLTLPEDYDRQVAFDRIARKLAESRPADFFRCYEELSKWANTPYALKTAAVQLAREDPRRLAGLLDGSIPGLDMEEEERSKAWQGLASGWARHDPHAALAYCRQLGSAEDRSLALGQIANRVIVKDPDLAAEIVLEAKGKTTLKEAAAALALTDPDGALAWLKKHFPTDTTGVAAQVARDHIPRSAAAAVDYLIRHTDVMFGVGKPASDPFSRWTVDDPQAALALADNISNPETRLQVRLLFLDSLALRAPAEAIAQAAPGPERNRILNQAVETWARQDLTSASAWLAAEPAGAERDRAIGGLLDVTLRVEPESALPWAAAISDKHDRINKLAWVLSRTNQRSPEEVTTAMQDIASSPEEITKILEAVQKRLPSKMKTTLMATASFLLSLTAGKLLFAQRTAQQAVPPAVGETTATMAAQPKGGEVSLIAKSTLPAKPGVSEQIAWERRMWQLDPVDFAHEFAAIWRTADPTGRAFRFFAIWRERDPDGLIAWARLQPESIPYGEAGYQFSLTSEVLKAALKKNPEFAWQEAAALSGNSHSMDVNRGHVIGHLLEQDMETARAFVRKHREEIAAFGQGNIGWYNQNPQKALPVALELPPGQVRTSIIAELARYYGDRSDSIAAAREWFQALPPDHRKEVSLLPKGTTFYRISESHRKNLQEVWPVTE